MVAACAQCQNLYAAEIEANDCQDGPELDADCKGIGGIGFSDSEEPLGDENMSGGADGKIFGEAFDCSEDDGLPPVHSSFGGFGTTEWI